MAAQISLTPIRSGRTDDWRDFIAELRGSRRIEWAQSQRRRGITREVISLASGDEDLAIVYSESADHDKASERLAGSDDPFDEWYRSRLDDLLDEPLDAEVVFDSAPKPGPWRGLRR